MPIPFIKMHGAGNDFIIFDARRNAVPLTAEQVRRVADRGNAVTKGCDQVIVMEMWREGDVAMWRNGNLSPHPHISASPHPTAFMRIYNADGGEVDACGNATRCVGWLLMEENNLARVSIQTRADILYASVAPRAALAGPSPRRGEVRRGASKDSHCQFSPHPNPPPTGEGMDRHVKPCKGRYTGNDGGQWITVDMGAPRFGWRDIPLAREMDTLHTGIRVSDTLYDPVAVSMGNPHAVFFVDDPKLLETTDMAKVSQVLQPFYPEGVNVSVAYVRENAMNASAVIDVRVWERGVGETPACGTAACAVMAAACRREPMGNAAEIHFQPHGHVLHVARAGEHLLLSGPVEVEFKGTIDI